jgi:hypothetical protein
MRLQNLDSKDYQWLGPTDKCWHYGDYTSEGGYNASETNRLITNLKKKPSASANELYYKSKAVMHWGDLLRQLLGVEKLAGDLTFVPMPGSKPHGHPEFDPRMLRVLERMALGVANVDVRPVLIQTAERPPQHHGHRLSPTELAQSLGIDPAQQAVPLRSLVLVVDDVITMGASFAAAKQKLITLPGVKEVRGVFLAKTVWPQPSFQLTPEQIRNLLSSKPSG